MYYPNLSDQSQVSSVLPNRRAWLTDLKEHHEDSVIRFRHDFKDSEFLFLCDVWPDVKNQRPTCSRWGIPVNKYPLLSVNKVGSFRTIKHFYFFHLFQTIDPQFARYFIWSFRHEAAQLYKSCMKEEVERKIAREKKKANPKVQNMEQWLAEWHLISQNGLPAKEAVRLASWKYCCPHLNVRMSAKEFNQKVKEFERKRGVQVYAFAVCQMYAQDERLRRALIEGTGSMTLLSVGTFKKEIWSTNSGHNLLGELHMHFRRDPTMKFYEVYSKGRYCYETSALIHRNPKPRQLTTKSATVITPNNIDQTNLITYYHQLRDEMNQQAELGNWNRVKKLAQSIEYLTQFANKTTR